MQSLVKLANVYIGNKKQDGQTANHSVVNGIAKYLTKMLKIYGANEGEQEIGFPLAGVGSSQNVRVKVSSSSLVMHFAFLWLVIYLLFFPVHNTVAQ